MNSQEIKEAIEYFKADTFLDKHIKLAISALEQQLTNGWIPVSERLPDKNGYYLVTDALNKLSAYEDTGLTPEEIKGLINTNENLVKQNDKQYLQLKKYRADRDYWKAEALKHCAKLGEIKILVGRTNE